MTQDNPEKMFEDVERFIAESRKLLQDGAVMELAGLDAEVERLCNETVKLSAEQRMAYADKLRNLLKDLTELGNELGNYRDEMASEIRNLTEHRKASVAYRAADATDAFGKNKDEEE